MKLTETKKLMKEIKKLVNKSKLKTFDVIAITEDGKAIYNLWILK